MTVGGVVWFGTPRSIGVPYEAYPSPVLFTFKYRPPIGVDSLKLVSLKLFSRKMELLRNNFSLYLYCQIICDRISE